MALSMTSTVSTHYIIHLIFSVKKINFLTGVYGNFGFHILHEEEKNRRSNNDLSYDTNEETFLIYCPL